MDSSTNGSALTEKGLSAEGVVPNSNSHSATPSPDFNKSNSDDGGVRNSQGEIRLNLVSRVVDYNLNYDFDFLQRLYKDWVKHDEYLVLREEEKLPNYSRRRWFAVKCSKRGNDVYQSRVRERLKDVLDILETMVRSEKKESGDKRKTNALYLTLSYDTKLKSRREAWENVGKEWNAFLTGMREKYGKAEEIRSWETFENGYPHIHTVIVFEKKKFDIWLQRKINEKGEEERIWRVGKSRDDKSEKNAIAKMWHSFVDVQGVVDYKEAVEYVVSYVLKERNNAYKNIENWSKKELLTAVSCWFFRKRCFSISRHFTDLIKQICIIQTKSRVQVTLEGKKACKKFELIGIIAGEKAKIDSYVWCKTYLKPPKWLGEVRKMKFSLEKFLTKR